MVEFSISASFGPKIQFRPSTIQLQLNQGQRLDLKQIKLVIDLMKRSDLTEFSVEEEGFKLKICRGANGLPSACSFTPGPSPAGAFQDGLPTSSPSNPPFPAATAIAVAPVPLDEPGIVYVKSPMVGTFYRSPSPESKSFAEQGTSITETSVVCIIEAMKIMNEIQSEVKGTVLEVLAENGQPVEYGQRLFKVKKD
jgi:acetyl-CoA carboxylase biotin carboxyl carrier protein